MVMVVMLSSFVLLFAAISHGQAVKLRAFDDFVGGSQAQRAARRIAIMGASVYWYGRTVMFLGSVHSGFGKSTGTRVRPDMTLEVGTYPAASGDWFFGPNGATVNSQG